MSSNLSEELKVCPGCNHTFSGGRADKVYCNGKCKSRFHNREAKQENATVFKREKELRAQEKKLRKLYDTKQYRSEGVPWLILQHEGVRLELYSEKAVNQKNARPILWTYRYGLEVHPKDGQHFILHHRTNL